MFIVCQFVIYVNSMDANKMNCKKAMEEDPLDFLLSVYTVSPWGFEPLLSSQ